MYKLWYTTYSSYLNEMIMRIGQLIPKLLTVVCGLTRGKAWYWDIAHLYLR